MPYKNLTKLPVGVEFVRISTYSPDAAVSKTVKEHIIEWSDGQNRAVETIKIQEYSSDWQNPLPSTLTIKKIELSAKDNSYNKIDANNKGYKFSYEPFKPKTEYSLWFIVSIKLKGEKEFDVAFFSGLIYGNPATQTDANIPARP